MGDYETPEETFPDKPVPGNWQVIYHGSNFMSYGEDAALAAAARARAARAACAARASVLTLFVTDPNPANYVNGSFIVWHLVDIVSKGGLMQIGYGASAYCSRSCSCCCPCGSRSR